MLYLCRQKPAKALMFSPDCVIICLVKMKSVINHNVKRSTLLGIMCLLWMTVQAQIDFKLYIANNVGEVSQLSRLKMTDSGLNWNEVRDGDANTNLKDVDDVRKMFSATRQKTREDQKLFWKMRDDNLLCFRINNGSGKHGEFEARATLGSGKGSVKKNVSNYFFLNTDNHSDSLFISVNRKGCSTSPNDTLHFKYYIYDYGDEDLMVFKLDSRRSQSGLTYQLECVTEDYEGHNKKTTILDLSGSSFQSFYRPDNMKMSGVYLVSNGNRLKLEQKRLIYGANLSDKLNRLWMGTNFTLDKHENRELTIFNMLGSGLFEQFDTLFVKVLGDGVPVKAEMDPQTKLAKGFTFNIAEVDANGNYVKRDGLPMKYVGYDAKNGLHKILTYGNPCYMEVYVPGFYPTLLKYAGAVNPTTKELDSNRSFVTLRLVKGTANATDPAISKQMIYILKDEHKEQMYNGKAHEVFTRDSCDMNQSPSSGAYSFIEDGGRQLIPKLMDNKPIEKYAEIAIEYSVPKSNNTAGDVAQIQFDESDAGTVVKTTPKSSTTVDGNNYPTFQRSWYTLRWDMVGVLPKVNTNYKPRLTIGSTTYNQLPFVRRMEYNEQKGSEDAKKKVDEYCFNKDIDVEANLKGFGGFAQILGNLCKFDIRLDNHPGFSFSVVPFLDPIRGRFETDVFLSIGFNGDSGKKFRDIIKKNARSDRWKLNEGDCNFGLSMQPSQSTSIKDKDHWILAELDDIFKVENNKLGKGFFFDFYGGFGIKWSWTNSNDPESGIYLKALSASFGWGAFAAGNSDPSAFGWKGLKWLKLQFYGNASAQIKGTLGIKSYNFKENGAFKERAYGFFADAMLQGKAGGGFAVGSDFREDAGGGGNAGGGANPDDGFIAASPENNHIGDEDSNAPALARPVIRREKFNENAKNRWFSFSFGARAGGKFQIDFGYAKMFNKPGYENDWGFGITALVAAEAFIDVKMGFVGRFNPRFSFKFGRRWNIPDTRHNPTSPLYPNYIPINEAPRRALWQAPAIPEFPVGKCIMDGLDNVANPYFMQDNKFLIVNNGDGSSFDNYRLTNYALPSADQKIDKADGNGISSEGHYVQHHSYRKEIDSEMMIYEEMTQPVDKALMADVDKELEQARHMQIASSYKSDKTGEWRHHVVAYDKDKQDSDPVAAINVWTEDGYSALPGEYDEAACVWKRGQFVLPPYEDAEASEEENEQNKQYVEDTEIRAFEGDVMLSVFDGQQWGAPESIVTLEKNDILMDYQSVMRNDTVLVALSVVPKGKNVPELRYYCKPAEEPVRYVGTDKLSPVRFSLDLVGSMPVIAILNQVDGANKDIYVKHIDMMGRYMNYGTDLSIARFNPESVKILVDKDNDSPADFAILWKCPDKYIRRDGQVITTDSTQIMLNCSRVYLRENMTTIPYVTLGCTADSTYISGYDAIMDGSRVQVLYTLTDERNNATYLMKDEVEFYDDFNYSLGYSPNAMIDADMMPVNLTVYNTGATPITAIDGFINDQDFSFDDIFICPYSSQTLAVDYKLPENFDGLLRANNVTAVFEDLWAISKASRRGAPVRRAIKSDDEVSEFAAGSSDLRCELLSHTIEGTVNKVYLELTDFDGLHDYETVHVGLYPDHLADVPICSTAEVLLKASDFTVIGNDRKAYVELTVDGLEEEQMVEIRARVYNDKVLDRLTDEDNIAEAIVDNMSWQDNLRNITLLPAELDDVTLLPVVKCDDTLHKVKVEQTEHGVWISGLEKNDHVRVFDALGKPIYQQRHPQSRLFVPIMEHGVYLLSSGQEFVKFTF